MSSLLILGAGSWGTALAIALASRFDKISLWAHTAERAEAIQSARQNERYLPGFALPLNVEVLTEAGAAQFSHPIVLVSVPSAHVRQVLDRLRPNFSSTAIFVSTMKGLENGSLYRMSQLFAEALPASADRIAVLSGPTFAKEVASGEPAAVVIASESEATAVRIQQAFSTQALRFYTSSDVVGVEIGAALKNVIAIGAGICAGLGLGSNSVAALVTRGLAEITRLAIAMGANPRTLSGLAGLGDLVLTATGDLSRNRYIGLQLGLGRNLDNILSQMCMVAEGVNTCKAAHQLGIQFQVDLPIVNKMNEILYHGKPARQALRELMDRPLTSEY